MFHRSLLLTWLYSALVCGGLRGWETIFRGWFLGTVIAVVYHTESCIPIHESPCEVDWCPTWDLALGRENMTSPGSNPHL